MNFLIVSGLSGSGKTIALQALEDAGFYCIDNLPAALVPQFAEHLQRSGEKNAAIGLDARNRAFLADVPQALAQLESLGIRYRIIFLHADEDVLVKRYKETRRRHPMAGEDTSLLEAIGLERELLEPLAVAASVRIDSTRTTPHDLRHQLRDFVRGSETTGMTLLFESFGYKNGTPLDADFVFDVRCLPNPYYDLKLRPLTGCDAPVAEFIRNTPEAMRMFDDIRRFISDWLPAFERDNRSYLTIAIGCTGGRHRSVFFAESLAEQFRARTRTLARHRELGA